MFAQITALVIFIAMFIFIVMDKIQRHIVTLIAGLLTCVLVFGVGMHSFDAVKETLNLHSIVSTHFWYSAGTQAAASTGINWETIIFIAGMMIMVEGMAEAGFFRWLCMLIAKAVHYKPIAIFIKAPGAFLVLAALVIIMNALKIKNRANAMVQGCDGCCATCAHAKEEGKEAQK